MNVCINAQLVQWILYNEFNDVTVISPEYLKDEILLYGENIVKKYKKG